MEHYGERLGIGTSPANELTLTDPTVSHYHLELRCEDGVLVKDLGSRNGTFVGDVRISEGVVPIGGDAHPDRDGIRAGAARRSPAAYDHPASILPRPVGAGTRVPLVTGGTAEYANLDLAASAPALEPVADAVADVLPLLSSVHRGAGYPPRSAPRCWSGPASASASSSGPATTTSWCSPGTPPTR